MTKLESSGRSVIGSDRKNEPATRSGLVKAGAANESIVGLGRLSLVRDQNPGHGLLVQVEIE